MADLNELSKLEQELKRRINQRNEEDKNNNHFIEATEQIKRTTQTFMIVREHGQPYKEDIMLQTRMNVKEHGQPYKEDIIDISSMVIKEHGQPYKFRSKGNMPIVTTNMVVKEHGQPFDFLSKWFK
jgi:hypothetical protein